MPYTIINNSTYLQFEQVDHSDCLQISSDQLRVKYDKISISSKSKTNEIFISHEILQRTYNIYVYNCFVDLSQFTGNLENIHLDNCTCTRKLGQVKIQNFVITNTQITSKQAEYASILQLQIFINEPSKINFLDLEQYESVYKIININNQSDLDIINFKGKWNRVRIGNCTVSSDIQKNSLFIKELFFTDCNSHTLQAFKNTISEQTHIENENQDINLDFKHNAQKLSVALYNCTLDLNSINGKWDAMIFTDCQFTSQRIKSSAEALISVIFTESFVHNVDFSAFIDSGLKINEVQINAQNFNLNHLQVLQPVNSIIANTTVDLQSLFSLKYFIFTNCTFHNPHIIIFHHIIFQVKNHKRKFESFSSL
ncbi:Hypothetical_protein [Hexamita inflata]|uniref:Hypothetical_protein n=1 Tax=Hexamita inflata TaxID=28002 RepID=A0AA86NMN0_9EUKA|nr:Hypothetical protein HINF_LOCUS9877 [Hexamita inflata]